MKLNPFVFMRRINQTIERITRMANKQQELHDEIMDRLAQLKAHADQAAARDAALKESVGALRTEVAALKRQLEEMGASVSFQDVDEAIAQMDATINNIGVEQADAATSEPQPPTT